MAGILIIPIITIEGRTPYNAIRIGHIHKASNGPEDFILVLILKANPNLSFTTDAWCNADILRLAQQSPHTILATKRNNSPS